MSNLNNTNFSFNLLAIILIVILAIILFAFIILMFSYLKLKKGKISNKKIDQEIKDLNKIKFKLQSSIDEYIEKIKETNNISEEELKDLLLLNVETFYKKDLYKKIDEWKTKNENEIKKISSEILINAMEKIPKNVIKNTSHIINIDEKLKGKIIGKEGRMIKAFEKITATNISVEKDSSFAIISSFNPLRKEIAINTLKSLIEFNVFNEEKLKSIYNNEEKKINQEMVSLGKRIVEEKLNLSQYIPNEIYFYIGRLKYRTSYSQSVLEHCLECSFIAESIAKDIGVNSDIAKLCAFMHDIGKSYDYEFNGDHVECGVELAKKFNFDKYVINAIESHHNKVPAIYIYSIITKIADEISASRPGVRKLNKNDFFDRCSLIEKICKDFKEVKQAYAIKSGRKVNVIVDPDMVNEDNINILIEKIKEKLDLDPIISKQSIDIQIIWEKIYNYKTVSRNIN